jgi:hypothetical protein
LAQDAPRFHAGPLEQILNRYLQPVDEDVQEQEGGEEREAGDESDGEPVADRDDRGEERVAGAVRRQIMAALPEMGDRLPSHRGSEHVRRQRVGGIVLVPEAAPFAPRRPAQMGRDEEAAIEGRGIAAAGHAREIVDAVDELRLAQRTHQAEAEGGASNSAPGEGKADLAVGEGTFPAGALEPLPAAPHPMILFGLDLGPRIGLARLVRHRRLLAGIALRRSNFRPVSNICGIARRL